MEDTIDEKTEGTGNEETKANVEITGSVITDEEAKAKADKEAKAAAEAAAKAQEEAAAKVADDSKMVKVQLTIETAFEVAKVNLKALKAATPENKLATARICGARVKATLKVL